MMFPEPDANGYMNTLFLLGCSDKQQFFQVSQIGILSNIYSDNPQIIMEAGFANFTV